MIRIAETPGHPRQYDAADLLIGFARDPQVRMAWVRMLQQDGDLKLRLLAYQALVNIQDHRVQSLPFPAGFTLDLLESPGANVVCVWSSFNSRIGVIGREVRCSKNLFFESDDHTIVINGYPDQDNLAIIRKIGASEKNVTVRSSRDLVDLITTLTRPLAPADRPAEGPPAPPGCGLSFSEMVGVIYQMCQAQALPARFVLHQVNEDMLYGVR